jgi:hypothetical protein
MHLRWEEGGFLLVQMKTTAFAAPGGRRAGSQHHMDKLAIKTPKLNVVLTGV